MIDLDSSATLLELEFDEYEGLACFARKAVQGVAQTYCKGLECFFIVLIVDSRNTPETLLKYSRNTPEILFCVKITKQNNLVI